MPIQGKTTDARGRLSLLLTGVIPFTVLLMCSCNQGEATRKSEAQNGTAPPRGAAAAPISQQSFRDAALKGEVRIVRQAIEQGVEFDAPDAEGRTALQLASFDGHLDVVRLLLESNPVVDRLDGAGRTALMYAASGSNHETVKALLEAGADPNIVDKVEGFSALMFAAAEGQQMVVQTLLSHGANATLRDVDGDTALDFALRNGHSDVVRLLNQKAIVCLGNGSTSDTPENDSF